MRSSSSKIIILIALIACAAAVFFLRSRGIVNEEQKTGATANKSSVVEREGNQTSMAKSPGLSPVADSPVPKVTFTKLEEFVTALTKAIESKSGAASISRLLNASRVRLKSDEHFTFLSSAIQQMAETDPTGALAVLRQVTDLHDQQILAVGIPTALVTKDPKAAAAWASSLAGHDMARNAHQTVAREWAKTDRPAIAEWLNQTGASVLKGAVAEGLAQTWASEDLDGLTEWARGITDPYIQTNVLVKATKILATKSPVRSR